MTVSARCVAMYCSKCKAILSIKGLVLQLSTSDSRFKTVGCRRVSICFFKFPMGNISLASDQVGGRERNRFKPSLPLLKSHPAQKNSLRVMFVGRSCSMVAENFRREEQWSWSSSRSVSRFSASKVARRLQAECHTRLPPLKLCIAL